MGIARLPRKAVADTAHGHLHRRVRGQHGLEQQALRHGRDIARGDVQHVRRVEIGLPLQERADRPRQQQVIGLPEVRHRVIAGPAVELPLRSSPAPTLAKAPGETTAACTIRSRILPGVASP